MTFCRTQIAIVPHTRTYGLSVFLQLELGTGGIFPITVGVEGDGTGLELIVLDGDRDRERKGAKVGRTGKHRV